MSVGRYKKDERNAQAGQSIAFFVDPQIPHLGLPAPNNVYNNSRDHQRGLRMDEVEEHVV